MVSLDNVNCNSFYLPFHNIWVYQFADFYTPKCVSLNKEHRSNCRLELIVVLWNRPGSVKRKRLHVFHADMFPACLSKYGNMTAKGCSSLHISRSLQIEVLQSKTTRWQLVASMHPPTQCDLSKLKGK